MQINTIDFIRRIHCDSKLKLEAAIWGWAITNEKPSENLGEGPSKKTNGWILLEGVRCRQKNYYTFTEIITIIIIIKF